MSIDARVCVMVLRSKQTPSGLPEGDAALRDGGPGRAVPCSCPTTLKLRDVRFLVRKCGHPHTFVLLELVRVGGRLTDYHVSPA